MPPDIRRNKQCFALSRRAEADDQHTLHDTVTTSARIQKRLRSRLPFSEQAKQLTSDAHGKTNMAWAEATWKTRWDTMYCRLREIIATPLRKHIGHDQTRHSLVRLNRVITAYGRFKYNMNQMGVSPSVLCGVRRCKLDCSPHCQRVSSTQLQRGLGHIEHCRTQLASRPAVCRIEDESSIKHKTNWSQTSSACFAYFNIGVMCKSL